MRILLASLLLGLGAVVAQGATFVVSNTADSGPGSLRQAIANANAAPGPDTIDFSIGTGAQTINVASPLVVTSPLIIDGATQEGFTGTPLITLFSVGTSDGLVFAGGADASVVRNLELARFYGPDPTVEAAAISITGANNVTVAGNYLGGPRGGVLFRNRTGIHIYTDGNTIGGLTSADRNVGVDEAYEVHLESTADANVIQGNYFGFDPTGLVAQFPATLDVWINGGSGNVVGGTQPGARNVMITSGSCVQITNGARNNRVEGNYLGLNANGLAPAPPLGSSAGVTVSQTGGGNIIGGSTAAARNIISNQSNGVAISQQNGVDFIRGNYIGTDPSGLTAIPNTIGIIGIFSPNFATFIGGSAPGEGNLISGNTQYGMELANTLAFVQGNLIGTDVTGLAALPNGQSGIYLTVRGANIGAGTASGRNVISGNGGDGIKADSFTQFNAGQPISGNFIGVGADGVTAVPNGGNGIALTAPLDGPLIQSNLIARNMLSGIRMTNATDVTIGGTTATANRIFGNQADGVTITGNSGRNTVIANSIDGNGGLGIDLGDDGVTINDPSDVDGGPNGLQNYPDLTRAITSTGVTVVTGTLFSTPATTFSIEFYASPAADPSGHGEGAQYLGTTAVVTDATGHATFAATVAPSSAGTAFTATATAAASGSSEFSNAVAAEAGGTLQFSAPAYSTEEGGTATITVTRTGGSAGTVTVSYNTTDGTATAGPDYTPATGTLTFLDGQTTATFTVATTPDGTPEDGETIQLSLSNATGGAALGSPAAAVLTIAGQADIPTLSELGALIFAALLALIAVKSVRSS